MNQLFTVGNIYDINVTSFSMVSQIYTVSTADTTGISYCTITTTRWRVLATFLRPVFAASHVQQVSDLHSKFALRPRHV